MKRLLLVLFIGLLFLCVKTMESNASISKLDDYIYYDELYFKFMNTGEKSGVGITYDEKVYTWGNNQYGELGTGDTLNSATLQDITENLSLAQDEVVNQIDVGYTHMIAYTSNNRVITWGNNDDGQLGNTTLIDSSSPYNISSYYSLNPGEDIIDVAAGFNSSFFITDDGRIFSWGKNQKGQLGDGSTLGSSHVTDQTSNFSLQASEYFVDIDIQYQSVVGLTNQGRIYTWGYNYFGNLGDGTTLDSPTEIDITSNFSLGVDEEIVAFSSGYYGNVYSTNQGRVLSHGDNQFGFIGDGTTVDRLTPVDITTQFGLSPGDYITTLSSFNYTLAVSNTGRVFGWGSNFSDQIHINADHSQYTPYEITAYLNYNSSDFSVIACTSNYTSYLLTDQDVIYLWGTNEYGGLLNGDYNSADEIGSPKKYDGTLNQLVIRDFLYSDIDTVATQYGHTLVYTESDRLYAWGYNGFGGLGTGDSNARMAPVDITDNLNLSLNETLLQIGVGRDYSTVLTSEYRVLSFGYNSSGQLGDGTNTSRNLPVDITSNFNLDIGDYIVDIYIGNYNSFYVTNNGKIYAVGNNHYGQLGDGTTTFRYSPIDITSQFSFDVGETIEKIVSHQHTLLLTSTGNLYAWGDNSDGQCGRGTTASTRTPVQTDSHVPLNPGETILDIQMGQGFSGLITSDGRIFMWGDNSSGYLGDNTTTERILPYDITNQFGTDPGETIVTLTINSGSSFVTTDTGGVFSWGANFWKQLGDGTQNDKKAPVEVTSSMNVGSDTFDTIYVSAYSTFLLTQEKSLYGFGGNPNGQIGINSSDSRIDPTAKITIDASQVTDVRFVDIMEETLSNSTYINYDIYFEYNLEYILDTIQISGVTYDELNIDYDKGKISVLIPNTYTLGNTPSFTLEQMTFKDASVHSLSGDLTLNTSIVEDTTPPTFDEISDITIELGVSPYPLEQYVTSLQDDYDENIDIVIDSGTLDFTYLGAYPISITATDDYGNSLTRNFTIIVEDTTPPVFTYSGPTVFELYDTSLCIIDEPCVEYDFLIHLTITDNSNPVIYGTGYISDLSWDSVGNYTIEFNVSDYSGNANTLLVDLEVVDTTPPIFDMIPTQVIEAGTSDIDWTTLIVDAYDMSGDTLTLTEELDSVVYQTPGLYSVSVSAEDASMNKYTQTFTVIVEDTTPPSFDDILAQTVEAGSSDVEWTTLVMNIQDNSTSEFRVYEDDEIDYHTPGLYTVTVTVVDESLNQTTKAISVTVEDTTNPTIEIMGDSTVYVPLDNLYMELGAVVSDNSSDIINPTISGDTVDTSMPGSYTVYYDAVDSSGNHAEQVMRVVIVYETIETYASLNPGVDSVGVGEIHIDSGVNVFSNLTYTVDTVSTVDTTSSGTYTITYTITDSNMYEVVLIRYVTVYEKEPVIKFLIDKSLTTLSVGDSYTNPSCTVVVNGTEDNCTVKTTNFNNELAGIYTVTYTYSYNGIEYTYMSYIFVYDNDVNLTLYIEKKKEGDF